MIFLTSGPPYPFVGARRIRDAQLIHLLSHMNREIEVLFPAPGTGAGMDESHPLFGSKSSGFFPPSVIMTAISPPPSSLLQQTLEILKPRVVQGYNQTIAAALKARAVKGRLLWVSRLRMAQYIPLARILGYRIILDEHQVESSMMLNSAFSSLRHWPEGIRAAQCALYEQRFCSAAHTVVTASDIDASRLQKLAPKIPVQIIPHAIDVTAYDSARQTSGNSLLFFGALNYCPNLEGLNWFSREIMPRLKASLGDAMPRVVVGSTDGGSTDVLKGLGMETGDSSSSVISLLRDAAVVFFPLRSGRGNRINILEAMAAGRAVVSTGKAADGLVLKPTWDICIAEQPDAFTSIVIRLLRDSQLRQEMGTHASRTVQDRFGWQGSLPVLDRLLSGLAE